MTFQTTTERRANQVGLDDTIFVLGHAATGARAEIWPALGFNCYLWKTNSPAGALDVLYYDPNLFTGGRPTRSGIPILFPFPNRIRDGRYSWQGKDYQLPKNDPIAKNAIHGFACRKPWRVVDQGADAASAWVTGEFQGSVDAPESLPLWPADYRLRITIRLGVDRLDVESRVSAPGAALPFGLGFHHYIRVPFVTGGNAADYRVQCPARQYWELADSLPTGKILPVDAARDLSVGRPFADLNLDDVLTDLPAGTTVGGTVFDARNQIGVRMRMDPAYREVVAFTPPHREAVCLEPYTCPTDAINLQTKGLDAGWRTLAAGAEWSANFGLEVHRAGGG
jgi:aldose 1-epimerase